MRKLNLPTNQTVFQQGDVILQRIDNADLNGMRKQEDLVLQLGEVTGHKHQFEERFKDRVTIFSSPEAVTPEGFAKNITPDLGRIVQITGDEAVILRHEEHKPIAVPPGTYKVSIVYEYDYVNKMLRQVAD